MRRKFAKAVIGMSLAAAMFVTSVPMPALADDNYGDMIELDCPAVYPADKIEKLTDMEIQTKVDALIKSMTEDEMYTMLGGSRAASSTLGYGTGYVGGVPRLGVPVIRMWDGPKGVISNYILETTSPASELALASSFSEEMAYDYGKLTGTDNKATAANTQLGVQLDLVRAPFFRRSRDSMGEDAYLTSKLGYQLSKGVQDQNVITTLKHLACYSETHSSQRQVVEVDEQTLHELYLAPYEYIIKNRAASAVMTSYNYISYDKGESSEPTSASPYLLKTVLRDMWGFTGLVMTDWGGNYQFSTNKGVDLETGTLSRNNRQAIEEAIAAGEMSWKDVETAVRHTLTAYGEIGYLGLVEVKQNGEAAEDKDPQTSIELPVLEGKERTALLEENDKIALESAVKGSVLLKNDKAALPVDKDDSIAMIGLLADHSLSHISESSWGWLQKMTGAYTEIKEILGENAKVTEAVGLDTIGTPVAAENLYTTEACTANGVNVNITTDDNTVSKKMDTIRLTTGTIDGKVNRTYKNSSDGTALVNGQTATMTAYLKAPADGTYEFEVLKIGGAANVTIYDGETETKINGSGSTTRWPQTGAVPTEEGMDVPAATTTVELVKDQVYRIEVTAEGQMDERDLQMSLNWFKPGDRQAQYDAAIEAAKNNKKVIYFAYDKGETRANTGNMDLPEAQLNLLKDVIAAAKENNNQVIVVLNAALPVTMDWLNDADAVLQMWLSGQSGGKAAAQLLTGVENPSGKLPVSWPKSINDTQYGVFAENYNAAKENNLDYTDGGEGIFSGYRWYDKAGIKPLYAFGYGLSYTDFEYNDLQVQKVTDGYDVTFTITNTGNVTGSDVAQVYIGKAAVPSGVQMAEKKLAAFVRVEDLEPGESKTVTAKIEARELSYWDTDKEVEEGEEKWVVAEGARKIIVSKSADPSDIELQTKIDVKDIGETPDVPDVPVGDVEFPDVYPEDKIENISDAKIREKVDALLKTMTEDEIYMMLGGSRAASSTLGYGTGYVGGVPRLGVPVIRMWDGPKGVISNYILETTSPASELALASSFSEEMAYDYGKLTGTDNKATAANTQLGVQLDLVRAPFFRRSRDSMGEDAYLTSKLGYQLSKGVQDQNVITTLKHLACYSETHSSQRQVVEVDEQTLHELYLAPYEYIIKNRAASAVMTSYNWISYDKGESNEPTSASPYLLKTVLRDMWGFTGLVMTDWGGNYQFSTSKGVDLETGTLSRNNRQAIEEAIAAGEMTWNDVLTAVRHTLTAYGEIGYLGLVQVKADGTAAIDTEPPTSIELPVLKGEERTALLEENDKIALESAVKGSVLLKNDNAALPVDKDDSIAMIGLLADHSLSHISESSWGWLQKMTGAYTEIKEILGENAKVTEAVGLDTIGTPVAAENLYTTEACTANGVNVNITTGDDTESKRMDTIRLTTGTIDGKVNRTYKNSSDGTALVNGQTATMTAYLKAPADGSYEFEVLKIGGQAEVTIFNTEEGTRINGSGSTTRWPQTGAVPTDEGMDVPASTTTVELVKDQVYRIEVTAAGQMDERDLQMSLNRFKPGDRDAQYDAAIEAAKNNKKVIYFAYDKGETRANTGNMDLPEAQLNLLKDVIAAAKENNNQVIVVLNAALPVTMDWLDDADAVLQMWLSGQSGGKAAAQLLTGVENPSGKLPVSWPKSIDDTQYGVFAENYNAAKENNLDYTDGGEGIFSGYRWYDKAGIEPLYAFGYGLSYTDFDYSDLKVMKLNNGYGVSFKVTNTGTVTGSDVAQIYLGKAEVPNGVQMAEKKLAAFVRTENLEPGESKVVSASIESRELSYWDASKNVAEGTEKWVIPEGEREIFVSKSANAKDIVLKTTINVKDIEITDEVDSSALLQAALEAAQAAADAAKEAADTAAQAAKDKAELQEIADKAAAAADTAQKQLAAAQKAVEEANANAEELDTLLKEAESAKKAAETAQGVAEAALQLVEQQIAAAKADAEAAEAAKNAAESQTAEAIKEANAAKAEAAKAADEAKTAQKTLEAAQKLLEEKLAFVQNETTVKSLKSKAKKKLTVKWKAVSGADGYVVQLATKESMKGAKKVTVAKAGAKSATIKKLKSKKKYYVRVCAYKKIGEETVYTSYSPIKSAKVK